MKICILTAHFLNLDQPGMSYATPFLYDYAKQWVSQGQEVHIIHFSRKYPKLFFIIMGLLNRAGISAFNKYNVKKETLIENEYEIDGIKIKRINYKKYFPHKKTRDKEIEKLSKIVIDYLSDKDFDVILGDCLDPTIFVISTIKQNKSFSKVKTALILHNSDKEYIKSAVKEKAQKYIDFWFFRSKPQKELFAPLLGINLADSNYGYLFSGIESCEISKTPAYRKRILKLLYVGALLKNKGLGTILKALAKSKNRWLSLTVVGDGPDKAFFEKMVLKYSLKDRVTFLGKKSRDEVFYNYNQSDALVLVSHETFGMVYVEAMSQACIPIGTVGEGIDGVVRNDENGFLVPLGNSDYLSLLFDNFLTLDKTYVEKISSNAFSTAKSFTNDRLSSSILKILSK